jgi:hypothetical protein
MGFGSYRSIAVSCALAVVIVPACSQGSGSGTAQGYLNVPDCWVGPFDLHPDFFAAIPPSTGSDSVQIRIQHGGDYPTFSDGIVILVDNAGEVRGDPTSDGMPQPTLLGQPLVVALPESVTPVGVPLSANATQAIVHANLYLNASCRLENDALYAVDAVTATDDMCEGTPAITCGAGESVPKGSTVKTSTIVFNALFDGNPDDSNTANLLTDATFKFYLADPREGCPGGLGPPPPCRGEVSGSFHFYFQQGRPAQPFP